METQIRSEAILIEGKTIEIRDYCPMTEKVAAGVVSIQGAVSLENNGFNDFLFEAIFTNQLVKHYSNFFDVFPEIKDLPVMEAYDILETNNVISEIIQTVESLRPGEIVFFSETIEEMKEDFKKAFNGPARALIDTIEAMMNMDGSLSEVLSAEKED